MIGHEDHSCQISLYERSWSSKIRFDVFMLRPMFVFCRMIHTCIAYLAAEMRFLNNFLFTVTFLRDLHFYFTYAYSLVS